MSVSLIWHKDIEEVPEKIVMEALWLLGDEAELAINGVTSIGLDGMSKGYSRGKCPPHICPKAWAISTGRTGGPGKTGRLRSGDPLWPCLRRS